MKSYDQYCALAKALDVVGDRWTLLIVRELLLRGSARYTDLANGLPGIATNLLADRLRNLEEAELVTRRDAPAPVATSVFELTDRGAALEPALLALGRWGAPLLAARSGREEFCPHWLALPTKGVLRDSRPAGPPVAIEVRTGARAESVTIEAGGGGGTVQFRPTDARKSDVVVTGAPPMLLRLLMGRLSLARARTQGVRVNGDVVALKRILPRATPSKRSHR